MDRIDYKKLYALQDKVLDKVFSFEHEFYLTGGTCLSRFYQQKRYSDDLDFFANSSNVFGFTLKKIKALLAEDFDLEVAIEAKDFSRLKVNHSLQLDFVNDRVPHYKDLIVLENGYVIDNIENILSNKITAVMGRDDPKDIFDIYLIAKFSSFDWGKIIHSAREKTAFNLEDLIIRLESFPTKLMDKIHLIDAKFLDNFTIEFAAIIEEIIEGREHLQQKGG
ncbi:MAG: nucleotidyl transferase AbiEii/AbiGii toxin family protein [Pseudomonadota bacterium]|nr:nucleotidyl transferase AbiEii/AbiGii toxin family protein [Pseudomonadota bacterium]